MWWSWHIGKLMKSLKSFSLLNCLTRCHVREKAKGHNLISTVGKSIENDWYIFVAILFASFYTEFIQYVTFRYKWNKKLMMFSFSRCENKSCYNIESAPSQVTYENSLEMIIWYRLRAFCFICSSYLGYNK